MSVASLASSYPIDQIFPVNPVYEHLFSGETFRCIWKSDAGSKLAVVRPYVQEGYWHCSVLDCGASLEDYLTKASCKGLVSRFLDRNDVPSDKSAWVALDMPPADRLHYVHVTVPQRQSAIKSEERTNVVYFVKAGGFIKIGFTSKPVSARINEFKTGCPFPTEILGTIEGGMQVERALHKRFAHLRSSGEWFIESDELLSYISERGEP